MKRVVESLKRLERYRVSIITIDEKPPGERLPGRQAKMWEGR